MDRFSMSQCLKNVESSFELVLLASRRSRDLLQGSEARVPRQRDKPTITALREIAAEKITIGELRESLISALQTREREVNSLSSRDSAARGTLNPFGDSGVGGQLFAGDPSSMRDPSRSDLNPFDSSVSRFSKDEKLGPENHGGPFSGQIDPAKQDLLRSGLTDSVSPEIDD